MITHDCVLRVAAATFAPGVRMASAELKLGMQVLMQHDADAVTVIGRVGTGSARRASMRVREIREGPGAPLTAR